MKKKYIVAIIIPIITTVIAGIFGIIHARITSNSNSEDKSVQAENVKENITNISYPESDLTQIDNIKENTIYISYDYRTEEILTNNNYNTIYNFGESTDGYEEILLLMAEDYYKSEKYDLAIKAYSLECLSDNKVALTNLGYIYAHGFDEHEPDEQKAKEYYLKADCIEASRNLLALYLSNSEEHKEESIELLKDLLFRKNDDVTWDFVSLCLFDKVWEDYAETTDIQKEEFKFDFYGLYDRWIYQGGSEGLYVPDDGEGIQYVLTGWDIVAGDNFNNYFVSYDVFKKPYLAYMELIDKMY